MRAIEKIIIHCSATPEGRDVTVETITDWHLARGWSDIGYHFVIHLNGEIKEGRPLHRAGAHTKGHNKGSIGICYIGGVDGNMKAKDTRTPAQDAALVNLIQALQKDYPLATIHGHNEFSSKACPSFNVQQEYGWLNPKD